MRDTRQLAEHLHLPPEQLVAWRLAHTGPPAVKIGTDWFYIIAETDAWLAAVARWSESAGGDAAKFVSAVLTDAPYQHRFPVAV
jgi:hypothetical protein